VDLPGYGIKYTKNRALTTLKLIISIPKILIHIKQENRWLRHFIAREAPDLIISDNRYGLYAPDIPTVFITHQLRIRTPFGRWADSLLQRIHYRAIRRFSRCWVPDLPGDPSLAGELSHPVQKPSIPTKYIGLLSRMERTTLMAPVAGEGALMILLSGPEPQRSLLEEKILDQVDSWSGRVVLIRGLPGQRDTIGGTRAGMQIFNHLPASTLNNYLQAAEFVIARAGYSSIMDLVRLQKKAILIPTPGQTEQEYLGTWLTERKIALSIGQARFSLAEALRQARSFPYTHLDTGGEDLLKKEIEDLIAYSSPRDFG
jgi:UDP-N-acetylglucosamine transferase subunit ALG13